MGTGWRRAFCTTVPRDPQPTDVIPNQPPPFAPTTSSTNTNSPSSTLRLQSSPSLRCKTTTSIHNNDPNTPTRKLMRCNNSNPSSPRSPFSLFKNSLPLSLSLSLSKQRSCGVCLQSVKTGAKMAIYTAECSHAFHFPCIATHVKKQTTPILLCPVCSSPWKHLPLIHNSDTTPLPSSSSSNSPKIYTNRSTPISNITPSSSSYNDDEPLITPRVLKPTPIPEAEQAGDDDGDDDGEFKGFFVNPVFSDESATNARDFRDVEVGLSPEAVVVSSGQSHDTYAVVLKFRAPPLPPSPSRRAPIDLVAVLDVGATMDGAKLQMLKRAMRLVISSLGSSDRLSIVAFAASPKRLLPLRRMTARGQRSARRIVDRLGCSQGSCAGEALRKATKVLEDRRERNPVASIILLSDGGDEKMNERYPTNQRQPQAHASSTRFAHVEIPVHAFSGHTAQRDPAENAFTKCVGGLLSVVVQDLRIQLGFGAGSDPGEISGVYSCNGRPTVLNPSSIRLGDLYAEEEREILVELRVPKSRTTGAHHVFSVRCSYSDPATLEVINGGDKALLVPRAQPVRGSEPRFERLRNLFIATRAVAESRQLAEQNELRMAQHLLLSARALVMQSVSVADEFVRGLEAELAEIQWRIRQYQYEQQLEHNQPRTSRSHSMIDRQVGVVQLDENGEPLTPSSAWRTADKLAKVAAMNKSIKRVGDLHGFENARF